MKKIIKIDGNSLVVDVQEMLGNSILINYDLFDEHGMQLVIKQTDKPYFLKMALREAIAQQEG